MTLDRDLERLLDGWLSDGPVSAPDRVLETVADRIERERQRPAWRLLFRRFPTMSMPIRYIALAGALLAALVLGGLLLTVGGRSSTPPPPPSPIALGTASPAPLPIELPDGTVAAGDYILRTFPSDPMAFTATIPEGWAGFGGWSIFSNNSGIAFLRNPPVVSTPCSPTKDAPPVAAPSGSVDEIVARLSAYTGGQVSAATDVTLAGYSGKRLDIQLPATLACGQHYVFDEPQGLYAQGPSNRWRVWVLDADGSAAVIVLMDYPTTSDERRIASLAIVNSVRIAPSSPPAGGSPGPVPSKPTP